MKEIIVVRHAHALGAMQTQHDFERALSPAGKKAAIQLTTQLTKRLPEIDYIIVSPSKRTRQTAQILFDSCNIDSSKIRWEEDAYEASLQDLIMIIERQLPSACSLLLIGHNPSLSALIYYLTESVCQLEPASMARMNLFIDEWSHITKSCGTLIDSYFP
jgi:phosphohistidine phosphatase